MEQILGEIDALIQRYYEMAARQPVPARRQVRLSAPAFDAREASRAMRTILGGWISQGPNVKAFEQAFSRYIGRAHGIAVNSGSSANLLALLSLREAGRLRDGDEVVVPAATFATVAMPVIQAGLVPVYVDVRRDTLNVDPAEVERAVSERTRILMPVHTLGYPADMPRLMEIAARHRLAVLEDCCEAHGSAINGRRMGSFGDIATFSFFVAHNMTTGEGGMIVTSRDDLETACRGMREFGRCDQRSAGDDRFYSDDVLTDYDRRYVFDRLGYNVRMTDVTAAFGLEQLAKLDDMNERRRSNAALLKTLLAEYDGKYLAFAPDEAGYHHTFYTFPITLLETLPCSRRAFAEHLESQGIETRPLFAGCLPDQPGLRTAPGRVVGSLTNSRFLRDRLVFVGVHPALDRHDVEYMAEVISSFISRLVQR